MNIIIRTAVTFQLPKEKELMEQFERDNPDWVLDTLTTKTGTFCKMQWFGIGSDEE